MRISNIKTCEKKIYNFNHNIYYQRVMHKRHDYDPGALIADYRNIMKLKESHNCSIQNSPTGNGWERLRGDSLYIIYFWHLKLTQLSSR